MVKRSPAFINILNQTVLLVHPVDRTLNGCSIMECFTFPHYRKEKKGWESFLSNDESREMSMIVDDLEAKRPEAAGSALSILAILTRVFSE